MQETFERLRALMLASAKGMITAEDGPKKLVLHAPIPNPMHPKQPMWFGSVQPMKNYVSVHLLPVYMNPAMQARISAPLKTRMQGKACFNFKVVDEALFADLAALIAAGAEAFSKPIVLERGPKPTAKSKA